MLARTVRMSKACDLGNHVHEASGRVDVHDDRRDLGVRGGIAELGAEVLIGPVLRRRQREEPAIEGAGRCDFPCKRDDP